MIAFLDGQDKVKPGPLGCVGHCMSGPFAVAAAARFPRMKAAASLYGVDMVTDAARLAAPLLDRVKGELYIGFAEIDPAVPSQRRARRWKAALRQAGTQLPHGDLQGRAPRLSASPRAPTTIRSPPRRRWTRSSTLWERNLK